MRVTPIIKLIVTAYFSPQLHGTGSYGALEEETCVSEVRAPVGSFVVLVKFDLLNQIRILDLEALSIVYSDFSHFDPNYIEKRSRERFLSPNPPIHTGVRREDSGRV